MREQIQSTCAHSTRRDRQCIPPPSCHQRLCVLRMLRALYQAFPLSRCRVARQLLSGTSTSRACLENVGVTAWAAAGASEPATADTGKKRPLALVLEAHEGPGGADTQLHGPDGPPPQLQDAVPAHHRLPLTSSIALHVSRQLEACRLQSQAHGQLPSMPHLPAGALDKQHARPVPTIALTEWLRMPCFEHGHVCC